jgi:SagB-type dehydrogenase family enzyme
VTNTETRVAREFHDRTAHSPYSVRTSTHALDWDIKPFPFKIYPDLPEVELPREVDPPGTDALAPVGTPRSVDATRATSAPDVPPRPVTLASLASVLYFSAGLTRRRTYPGGGEVRFRAAPSTGALYQTEVYVVAGALEGMPAGVYHFSPGDFRLRQLRDGDHRGTLAAVAVEPELARRPATLILTAIYWRNTWKYGARGYRHLFWDSGTMLANVLATAGALGLDPHLVTGFVDAELNELLGLDPEREASLELVRLGRPDPAPAPARPIEHLRLATVSLSSEEVDYPLLREIHAASSLGSADEVTAWRRADPLPPCSPEGEMIDLPAPRQEAGRTLGDTVLRRGSTRQFSHDPISATDLSTALFCATRSIPADVPSGLVQLFLVVSAVEGIELGAYRYWPHPHRLERIRTGDFRSKSAYLCLEQALGGDAAVTIYFLAPLREILPRWGNRGYRLANLEAGLDGGRAYLAAYAQGFGATGLTFYDRDVVSFFEPASAGLDAIFVTALGRSVRTGRTDPAPLLGSAPRETPRSSGAPR